MIKNYFKIAWRNLFRNKGFSLVNLLGLTTGMTCAILILLWVQDELNYNKFHKNYPDIYQVMAHRDFNNQVFTDQNMVLPLAGELERNIPAIKNATVTTGNSAHLLTVGDKKLKKNGFTVGAHFFDIFSWKFIEGNAANALPDAYSIVLTKSAAEGLFGQTKDLHSLINKVVRVDNEYDAKVTAIVEDVAGNSSFDFDFINAFNYDNDYLKKALTNWVNSSWRVYIQTVPGADIEKINKQITALKYERDNTDRKVSSYFGFPMNKWRLYSDFKDGKNIGGMISYVRMFSIIAVIILLIACINFMNLSTARSEKRAREVGVRKTLGSLREHLVMQFFAESLVLAAIAFLFSVGAVYALLPAFNDLVGKQLSLHILSFSFFLGSLGIIILTGVIAGSYPALYLSGFSAVKVLKGTFLPGKNAGLPRKILVVGQFVISILLISATIVIYQQIQHIKNRDIGYDPNNLIMVPMSPDSQKNFEVMKTEMLRSGKIAGVTRSMSPVTSVWWKAPAPEWPGKAANAQIIFTGQSVDADYAKTMGIKMLQGKDFTGSPSDSTAIIFNKAAADIVGRKDLVGTQMKFGRTFTLIGVMDNVTMGSPFEPVEPMMIFFEPNNSNYINVRVKDMVKPQDALSVMASVFKKYDPSVPFDYQFVDKEFGKKFATEELINKLTNIFAILAIFICCLGLAGLASFTIEKRIREIGIRKVLGASVGQVLQLISKEFVQLVIIAFLIAVPVAWWFMNNWLAKYSHRVNISIWMFAVVGLCILGLTVLVVSLNAVRAAVRSPVKSLRSE